MSSSPSNPSPEDHIPEAGPDGPGAVILDSGSHQVEGWVTAAPPKFIEVLQHVAHFPVLLHRHRDLITTSVKRELSARFRGTVLGWAWPLVTPMLMFAIYFFIFTKLLGVKFGDLPEDQRSAMGVFMFVGILVWSAFGESVSRCTGVIVDNGNLIKKVAFPTEILPLNQVLVHMVTMAFGVVAFIVVTWLTPLFGLHVWQPPEMTRLPWLLLLMPLQVLFTYGLGLILGTLQVYLRDTLQIVTVAITVWMFATPIFWTPELIINDGVRGLGEWTWIVEANPVYHLVYAWRDVLMSRLPEMVFHQPIEASVLTFSYWAIGSFVVGYTFFLLARRRFADEI
ncbi:MAG: lipopolysaccharide transport system permease protein [Planctomycetota bacterium]|jgi:lipopolysaccharide transport system permease protein